VYFPENIHTSPAHKRDFLLAPAPPLWKFQLSLMRFYKCFGLRKPPIPEGNPIPPVGERRESMDIFWNYTLYITFE